MIKTYKGIKLYRMNNQWHAEIKGVWVNTNERYIDRARELVDMWLGN